MRAYLFFPRNYSIDKIILVGLRKLNIDAEVIDYNDILSDYEKNLLRKTIPIKFVISIRRKVIHRINQYYQMKILEGKPDFIIIYNNQYFNPECIQSIKKITRIGFYLGDSPFYTFTDKYNLAILFYADFIISPDSYWKDQLEFIGIRNIYNEVLGYDEVTNCRLSLNRDMITPYENDVLFIGNISGHSWGYKRCTFLKQFARFNMRIYGSKSWLQWIDYFPELKSHLVIQNKPLSFEQVNLLSNCAKVYPVDANPGMLNGLHQRIFDCIGSGLLPLVEYRKDLDSVFKNCALPIITNYSKAEAMADYYISREKERFDIVEQLRVHIKQNFSPEIALARILHEVGIS